MANELKVNPQNNYAKYVDSDGDALDITIYSNGQTAICINSGLDGVGVILDNHAAHQLRDMLNKRFP
jgi:hypothetical protein